MNYENYEKALSYNRQKTSKVPTRGALRLRKGSFKLLPSV